MPAARAAEGHPGLLLHIVEFFREEPIPAISSASKGARVSVGRHQQSVEQTLKQKKAPLLFPPLPFLCTEKAASRFHNCPLLDLHGPTSHYLLKHRVQTPRDGRLALRFPITAGTWHDEVNQDIFTVGVS